ncbi:hypothetical protein [Wenjunlia tyrosinilytica]|uniref:DUF4034 domain-containing protein n=1 Tax=Wenjunlia tyrosinilytica TaxID=1544741 RepID=A0A917ZVN5_9ACTN|nr:hypothetical protein [Wenjunlia tyrosinilytica]GGO96434.1 hypothetical protein GCM10012280_55910 [Wenjunlia tyrosinilytica]
MARFHSRNPPPVFDATGGDKFLAEARRDLVMGRWQTTRDLLRDTGQEWGLRTHRMRLLADTAAAGRAVESWQVAEPGSTDALALRGETEVARAFAAAAAAARSGSPPSPHEHSLDPETLDRVGQICWEATQANHADPVPWVSLLALARLYAGGHPRVWAWWDELRARDPYNREAHHQVLRHLSARWHGSHGATYDFARDCAAVAPAGTPLAVLAQAARVEHFRLLVRAEGTTSLVLTHHWKNEAALADLRVSVRQWLAHLVEPCAAHDVADLNLLAHGLVEGGMLAEAATAFHWLGNRATQSPWAYGGDPEAVYASWRDRLIGPRR